MINDNLARNYNMEQVATALPKKTYDPSIAKETPTVATPKVYVGLTRVEAFMIAIFSMAVFALLIFNVYSAMYTSNLNRQVQDMNEEIMKTEVVVDNLTQHVHELSRYERVYKIAEEQGLKMNEKNVKNLRP
ncbi:cell division protein FtsL [Allofustis seminis]|uniref:cell division protein FtsL n=1 Tax=Allofustis seminis TaxID=166939 RepID=UPI0003783AAD|nr:cell division protein FtsL [Allofustis seminis]